jgi:hypothetical protein
VAPGENESLQRQFLSLTPALPGGSARKSIKKRSARRQSY